MSRMNTFRPLTKVLAYSAAVYVLVSHICPPSADVG